MHEPGTSDCGITPLCHLVICLLCHGALHYFEIWVFQQPHCIAGVSHYFLWLADVFNKRHQHAKHTNRKRTCAMAGKKRRSYPAVILLRRVGLERIGLTTARGYRIFCHGRWNFLRTIASDGAVFDWAQLHYTLNRWHHQTLKTGVPIIVKPPFFNNFIIWKCLKFGWFHWIINKVKCVGKLRCIWVMVFFVSYSLFCSFSLRVPIILDLTDCT